MAGADFKMRQSASLPCGFSVQTCPCSEPQMPCLSREGFGAGPLYLSRLCTFKRPVVFFSICRLRAHFVPGVWQALGTVMSWAKQLPTSWDQGSHPSRDGFWPVCKVRAVLFGFSIRLMGSFRSKFGCEASVVLIQGSLTA